MDETNMMFTNEKINKFDLLKICENPVYVDNLLSSLTNQERKELEKLQLLLHEASYEEIENVLCKFEKIIKEDMLIVESPIVKEQMDIFLHPLFKAMW